MELRDAAGRGERVVGRKEEGRRGSRRVVGTWQRARGGSMRPVEGEDEAAAVR